MLIPAAGLKRELLTKNGLKMSVRIKIFSETLFYLLAQPVMLLLLNEILNDIVVLFHLGLAFTESDALPDLERPSSSWSKHNVIL